MSSGLYPWRQVLDRVGERLIIGHNLHIYLDDGYARARRDTWSVRGPVTFSDLANFSQPVC